MLAFLGDGATSEGDFHEALNFAGVWTAPVVFVCQNNGWAISLPRSEQSASATLAQKAVAYGVAGLQVDGNDALAVYRAATEALDRARSGGGATLIEAITYRREGHSSSDDPSVYRDPREPVPWHKKDPVNRLRGYLRMRDIWSEEHERQVIERHNEEIASALSPRACCTALSFRCSSIIVRSRSA